MRPAILVLGMLLVIPTAAFPATLHVPGDYLSIQEAIDASAHGDKILVAPGTYVENIDFIGKAITLKSSAGPEATVIDGQTPSSPFNGSVITFQNAEGLNSVLDGFLLVNGTGYGFKNHGGGIYCEGASPFVKNCIIWDNSAGKSGGGIYLKMSFAMIESNLILENTAEKYGGGIYCEFGAPTIRRNTISGNTVASSSFGGGIYCTSCNPEIDNNTITHNSGEVGGGIAFRNVASADVTNNLVADNTALLVGGGIYCYKASPTLSSGTVSRNIAGTYGGGLYIQDNSFLDIQNTIFWNNGAAWAGPEAYLTNSSTLAIAFSDVKGGQAALYVSPDSTLSWGAGMLEDDPLFFAPGSGDFHLKQDPCQPGVTNPVKDAGDPASLMIDGSTRTDGIQDEGVVDMGYHYPLTVLLVPELYATIQNAVDVAVNGDAILVAPGTYVENIDFLGKTITVRSDTDRDPATHDLAPADTFIDGALAGPVVAFGNNEGPGTALEGFTLSNGSAKQGGGILCLDASPRIAHNIITGNSGDEGGGIACIKGSPSIENNLFHANAAVNFGGAVHLADSSADVVNNTFLDNTADQGSGGAIACINGSPWIAGSIIHGNTATTGGGIYVQASSLILNGNTVIGNTAAAGGGIILFQSAEAWIKNTILWDNDALEGAEIYLGDAGHPSILHLEYSDLAGGPAAVHLEPGNVLDPGPAVIDADPLFADAKAGDFHLTWLSPCLNRGVNGETPAEDPDGDPRPFMGTMDMGADEFVDAHPLAADNFFLSEGAIDQVHFTLDAGYKQRNRNYLVLGSITGTVPGIPLPGSEAILPLNWDIFTTLVMSYLNSPLFVDFMGKLDNSGQRTAMFDTLWPLPYGLAGITIHFAYTLNKPWDFVSNPINVEIVP